MKKTLLPISLLLTLITSFSMVYSQPVITSNAAVGLGESVPVQFAQGGFNPGLSGANVNWDFSALQDAAVNYTWEALAPSASPFSDSFPAANLAFLAPAQDGLQDNWIYYDWDASAQTLDLQGSAAILNGSTSQDTFFYNLTQNPKRVQTFPFTDGDSYTDAFSGHSIVNFGNFAVKQTRTGSITVESDGYGSLVTPAGTFQNVLRIKTTESLTDTYMGFGTTQSITRYTWYSADEKYLLLHMDSIVVQPQGGPSNTSTSVFYRSGAPLVAVEEAQLAEQWRLNVFPNPAQNQVQVSYQLDDPAPARLVLCNLIGQELRSMEIQPGSPTHRLDLQGISPGIYTVQILQGGTVATRKLIVQ